MKKGILAQLLEALEKTPSLGKSSILAELVQPSREPIEGQWKYPFHLVRHAAIEIIKSGIFVEDHLKGKPIPSIPPKFLTYPIKDPEELVWRIALPLVTDIEKERNQRALDFLQKEVNRYFSQVVENMDFLSRVIEPWAKPKTKEKIDKIKGELDSLKEELWGSLPKDSFKLEDPINYMFNLLQKQAPNAPEETIAKRVKEILEISNIGKKVRHKSILQKRWRKKKKST
jgi:hypothetical protein